MRMGIVLGSMKARDISWQALAASTRCDRLERRLLLLLHGTGRPSARVCAYDRPISGKPIYSGTCSIATILIGSPERRHCESGIASRRATAAISNSADYLKAMPDLAAVEASINNGKG